MNPASALSAFPLVGQTGVAPEPPISDAFLLLGAVAVVVLGLVGVAGFAVLRHSQRQGELRHERSMRALELGRILPGEQPGASGSATTLGIGLGVPVASFATALAFSLLIDEPSWEGFSKTHMAWLAATIVGGLGVICGTILASRRPAPASAALTSAEPLPVGKPRPPTEALDFAGRSPEG